MTRSILLTAILCAGASVAHADGGMLPGGATLTFNRLFLHENNNQAQMEPALVPDSLWHYFNYAHCACSIPGAPDAAHTPWYEGSFGYEMVLNNQTTLIHAPLEIWVGTACDDTIMRPMNCHQVMGAGTPDIASIPTTVPYFAPEVPILDLMIPEPAMQGLGCRQRVLSTAEWAISDVNPDGTLGSTPQYFVSQGIDTNTLAPALPTDFKADGAESAIQLSWTPSTDVSDIVAYYQALCAIGTDGQGGPVTTSPPAAKYQTPHLLCGSAENLSLMPTTLPADNGVDADSSAALGNLGQLDPSFICGEVDDATATGMRIDGLHNGTTYTVVLLAIDKYGNASGTNFTSGLTPKPVTNFWQDLHNRGSDAEGGFCLIADTYGDDSPLTQALRGFRDDTLANTAFGRWLTDVYYGSIAKLGAIVHGHWPLRVIAGILLLPVVAVALLWHLLTLPGLLALVALAVLVRRRRRVLSTAGTCARTAAPPKGGAVLSMRLAPAILALVVLVPGRAHAQAPYWENQATGTTTDAQGAGDEPNVVKWHVGVRAGPYVPQIDAQLGITSNGPFQAMFGGYSIMPMLDVNRILWRGLGQLGVGLSVGYMGKTAHAWAICADPTDPACSPTNPNRMRSTGDTNSFRLIPFQVTGVYRFTWLDDEYGVPVIPYARAGLAYYIWWVKAPDGSYASVVDPDGSNNKAHGASLGIVGSLGLALRAERIDASAAQAMRESGIEHAGFYGEVNLGWVDGLGLDHKKLSVGDTTWFAGVDFEF